MTDSDHYIGMLVVWWLFHFDVKLHSCIIYIRTGNPQQIQHAQQLIRQKCDMMVSQ